jgi:hypothetical protein
MRRTGSGGGCEGRGQAEDGEEWETKEEMVAGHAMEGLRVE